VAAAEPLAVLDPAAAAPEGDGELEDEWPESLALDPCAAFARGGMETAGIEIDGIEKDGINGDGTRGEGIVTAGMEIDGTASAAVGELAVSAPEGEEDD
jgi:hypothetical protein